MRLSFFPSSDAALLAWSANFNSLIVSSPNLYGLTSSLASSYTILHNAYATALAACEPSIRTKAAVSTKNVARTNLKNDARLLANIVNGTASVTDAQKISLGLNVRSAPTPVPPPSSAPTLALVSVLGRTARLKLSNSLVSKRGKPPGVIGAAVFSFVGPAAPVAQSDWHFEGNTNQSIVAVQFPDTVPNGSTVWFTAMWYNRRSQSGPAATPLSANLPGGSVMPMAA